MLRNKKGQSTLEYAVIVVVIVAALLAIQHYMSRGVQGKLRESVDSVGDQYSAGNMTGKIVTSQAIIGVATEKFGQDAGGGRDQGVSRYDVTFAAPTTRSATGADAETVTLDANAGAEPLF